MPTPGPLLDVGAPDDQEAPEAVLVSGQRERGPVGRPGEGPLPWTPCRLGLLVRLREDGGRVGAVAVADPDVRPPAAIADEGQPGTVRRPAGLAYRLVRAAGDDATVATVGCRQHHLRSVPRHVREIPLVPGQLGPVGTPSRVPRVVGVAHRSGRVAVGADDGHRARIVGLDDERDAGAIGRARRRRGSALGRQGGARASVGGQREEATVGGGDDQPVGTGPRERAAPGAHRGVGGRDDRGPGPIGGGDQDVGSTRERLHPSQAATVGRPAGLTDEAGSGDHGRRDRTARH